MGCLSISLLGPFRAGLDDQAVTGFETAKTRVLLACLAEEAGRAFPRSTLAGLLWPERPESAARNNLRHTLAVLRQAIHDPEAHPPYLAIGQETISFNPTSDCAIDTLDFNRLVGSAGGLAKPGVEQLAQAAALYRGDFLEGLAVRGSPALEEWILSRREQYRSRVLEALYDLTESYLAGRNFEQAKACARRQIEIEPWYEEAHRQLMLALAGSGRRSEALAQYNTCCQVLETELGVEPSQATRQLLEHIRSGDTTFFPPTAAMLELPALARHQHNLPRSVAGFIGREKEIETLKQIILSDQTRLVTVTGAGGSGKTRLALRAAEELLDTFPQGVWLVEIGSQNTAESLLPIIAQAIGLDFSLPASLFSQSEEAQLQVQLWDYLQDKTMLLVLDSFETILDASVQVYDLLRVTSTLKILITSRARLNIEGETVFPLGGLSFPATPEAPDETAGYEALDLFVDIARRTHPTFTLSVKNRPAIAEICRQTQGMPLGILLAAGWCRVLEPEEIVLEIRRSLDFLSDGSRSLPDRQRSLRATFEYSWGLLAAPQRIELMRLSIFPGAFSAARAAQVCGVSLPALKALIDQSLLQPSAESRFRMHDLLRQFTREKLDTHPGEALALQRQFVHAYLDALAGWSARLKSADQLQALAEMNLEQDNFRLAWEWAVQQESIQLLAQALDGFCRYFYLNCRYQEGLVICRQSEQRLGDNRDPVLQAGLRRWQGVFLVLQGEGQRALQVIQPLVADLQEKVSAQPGLERELAAAGLVLADIQNANPTLATLKLAQQSLRLFRSLGNPWGIARALCTITAVHDHLGNRLECYSTALEALEILGPEGDPHLVTLGKISLSFCYMLAGDYQLALDLVQELVIYYHQVGNRTSQARANSILLYAYWYAGQFAEARMAVIQYHEDIKAQEGFLKLDGRKTDYLLALQEMGLDLFTGRYDDARANADRYGRENEYIYPLCQAIIGVVHMIQQDLGQAVVYLERSCRVIRQFERQDHTGWPLAFLSLAAWRMKEYEKSRSYLIEALAYAEKYPVITVICLCLADLALFLAEGGDAAQAVEIYAAVTIHPMAKNAIFFYDLFQVRIDALAAGLPAEVADQARQRGRGQNLRELVHKYRQRLIQHPDFCSPGKAEKPQHPA